MMTQPIVKLPFFDVISRTFKYVLKNKKLLKAILPLIAVLTVFQLFIGRPYLCVFDQNFCHNGWPFAVTTITTALAAIGVIINYCRSIILKADTDYVSMAFWKRVGLYIATIFLLTAVIGVPFAVIVFIVSNLHLSETVALMVLFITTVVLLILTAPLFLLFPAVSSDDYSLFDFKKIYTLTKGNFNTIFWSHFIIMFPYLILSNMLLYLYNIILPVSYTVNLLFLLASISLGIADSCIKGAFFAHIYQFFKFYNKDN